VVPSYAIQLGTIIEAIVMPEAVTTHQMASPTYVTVLNIPARNTNSAPENTMLLVSIPV
jgi:hypothetical protein